jgi:hypothetical protein
LLIEVLYLEYYGKSRRKKAAYGKNIMDIVLQLHDCNVTLAIINSLSRPNDARLASALQMSCTSTAMPGLGYGKSRRKKAAYGKNIMDII